MATKHSAAGAAATRLILEVFRANGLLLAVGDRLTRPLGLTSARWQVLGALADGPATVAQVARDMGLARQSVQRLANLLEKERLVAFAANPNHRRAALVELTSKGRSAYDRISEIQARWVNRLASGLDARKLEGALVLLKELQARLRASPQG